MKNRSREHGGGMSIANSLDQVVERADPARGDHRHANRIRDGARQSDVETRFSSVAIHRGQQDLAGSVIGEPASPGDCLEAGRPAATMGEYLPPPVSCALGV